MSQSKLINSLPEILRRAGIALLALIFFPFFWAVIAAAISIAINAIVFAKYLIFSGFNLGLAKLHMQMEFSGSSIGEMSGLFALILGIPTALYGAYYALVRGKNLVLSIFRNERYWDR